MSGESITHGAITFAELMKEVDGVSGLPLETAVAKIATALGLSKTDIMFMMSTTMYNKDLARLSDTLPLAKFAAVNVDRIGSQILAHVQPGGYVVFPISHRLHIRTDTDKDLHKLFPTSSHLFRSYVSLFNKLAAENIHAVVVVDHAENFTKSVQGMPLPENLIIIDRDTIKQTKAEVSAMMTTVGDILRDHSKSEDFSPAALKERLSSHKHPIAKDDPSAPILFIIMLLALYRIYKLSRHATAQPGKQKNR